MKFSVSKSDLYNALLATSFAIDSANIVYGNIIVSVHDAVLELKATNTVIAVQSSIPAAVTEPADFVVDGSRFIEFVKPLTSDELQFSKERQRIVVHCGSVTAKFNEFALDAFPEISFASVPLTTVRTVEFQRALRSVFKFCSTGKEGGWQDTVLINAKDGYMLASDKIRIAKALFTTETPGTFLVQILESTADIISKVIAPYETIEIGASGGQLIIKAEGLQFSCALYGGATQWPYEVVQKLLVSPELAGVDISKKEFYSIVKAIGAIAKGSAGGPMCTIKLSPTDGVQFLYADDLSERQQIAETAVYHGTDALSIYFNVHFPD